MAMAQKSTSGQGPKKLIIKPFKVKPKLPENFETETWCKLQSAVNAVYRREPISSSEEEIYRAVENMCLHKMDQSLYSRLEAECNQLVSAKLRLLLNQTGDPEQFLALVDKAWQDHCQAILTLRNFFLYLDRTYVLQTNTKSLWEMGLSLFRGRLQELREVESKTVKAVMTLVQAERCGEAVPRSLLRSVVRMLSSLRIYESVFEGLFLLETERFYEAEGAKAVPTMGLVEYLAHAEGRLNEETDRCDGYLDQRTKQSLLQTVRRQLVKRHTSSLLEAEAFLALMEGGRVDDIARLYRLLSQVDALDELKVAWHTAIKRIGSGVMAEEEQRQALAQQAEKEKGDKEKDKADKDKEKPAKSAHSPLIGQVMDLKKRLDFVFLKAMQGNEAFTFAMKDAFENFLNTTPNMPAQLLAKYVDEILKTGAKGCNDEELSESLDRVMVVFRYLAAKDVFEAFYKKDLAKRLLLGRSASTDAEKMMIQKLKDECGHTFTTKLEGMFKDVDLSRDVQDAFLARDETLSLCKSLAPAGLPRLEFECHVITSGTWPHYPTCTDIIYPPQAAKVQASFEHFYTTRHNGRKIQWITSLGQCTLRTNFFAPCSSGVGDAEPMDISTSSSSADHCQPPAAPNRPGPGKGRHELVVSHAQALVLLLFNSADSLAYPAIQTATGIPDGDLKRTLVSLSLHKQVKLLMKQAQGREVHDDDVFDLNVGFTHKLFRITVNQVQAKETKEEVETTEARVFEDRQYQVDAAIVRIMKFRKKLSHTALMTEIFKQLSFPCKATDIKKRIESLIEREYLERDADAAATYNYLA